jgi:hypothetical protein
LIQTVREQHLIRRCPASEVLIHSSLVAIEIWHHGLPAEAPGSDAGVQSCVSVLCASTAGGDSFAQQLHN